MMNMLLAAILLGSVSFGGQPFGSFTGSITDPVGGLLPNVRVILAQPERQARYEIRTDRTGQFEFLGLPAGEYQIETELAGFQPHQGSVTIAAATVRRTITLQIGRLQETIRITEASVPLAPAGPARSLVESPCPAAAAASTIGGNLRPPVKLRDVKPDYPAALRGSGRDATLIVEARVGLDGYLKDIQLQKDVEPAFADSLVAALREWRFSSTLLNCVPQEVDMTITARFEHR